MVIDLKNTQRYACFMKRFLAVALAGVLLCGCGEEEEMEQTRIDVSTATAEHRDIFVMGEFVGMVETSGKVSVYPRISAPVITNQYKVGDQVKQGDVLCKLDDRELQIEKNSAAAQMDSASASLTSERISNEATKAEANETLGQMEEKELELDNAIAAAGREAEEVWNNNHLTELQEDRLKTEENNLRRSRTELQKQAAEQKTFAQALKGFKEKYLEILNSESDDAAKGVAKAAGVTDAQITAAGATTKQQYANVYLTTQPKYASVEQLEMAIEAAAEAETTATNEANSISNSLAVNSLSDYETEINKRIANLNALSAADAQKLAQKVREDFEIYSKARIQAEVEAKVAKGDADVETAEAAVADAQASLDSANLRLGYTTITAPFSGIIREMNIQEKGMALAEQPAYVIESMSGKKIRFYVSKKVKAELENEQAVTIHTEDGIIEGVIISVGDIPDQETSLFAVDAVFPESESDAFIPETYVKLRTVIGRAEDVLTLPVGAIFYSEGKPYVYVVKGQKAVKTDITTGMYDDTGIEVLSGITDTDAVIVSWTGRLRDQVEVNVVEDEEAQSDPPSDDETETEEPEAVEENE